MCCLAIALRMKKIILPSNETYVGMDPFTTETPSLLVITP